MSDALFDLFPGWQTPPNDPSRELRPAFMVATPPVRDFGDEDEPQEERECITS